MKLMLDARTFGKIVQTGAAIAGPEGFRDEGGYGQFEYIGPEGGIKITISSPSFSFGEIRIRPGWGKKPLIEGTKGERFAISMGDLMDVFDQPGFGGGVSDDILMVAIPEENTVTFKSRTSEEKVEKRQAPDIRRDIPDVPDNSIQFGIPGGKMINILKRARAIEREAIFAVGKFSLNASIGPLNPSMEGIGFSIISQEADDFLFAKHDLPEEDVKENFASKFYPEPMAAVISAAKTAKDEEMKIAIAADSPISFTFRIKETVFVKYIQVQVANPAGESEEAPA